MLLVSQPELVVIQRTFWPVKCTQHTSMCHARVGDSRCKNYVVRSIVSAAAAAMLYVYKLFCR